MGVSEQVRGGARLRWYKLLVMVVWCTPFERVVPYPHHTVQVSISYAER